MAILRARGSDCGGPAPRPLVLCLALLSLGLLAKCEPSQQQRGQQANELSQDFSGGTLGGGGGLGLAAYTNAKRARKMSAFMPMRGRKDGRDLIGTDSLRAVGARPPASYRQQQLLAAELDGLAAGAQLVRESDPMDDVSGLARLISAAAAAADNYQAARQSALRDNATPRQFYNQFQAASAQFNNGGGGGDGGELGSSFGGPVGTRPRASLEQADPMSGSLLGSENLMVAARAPDPSNQIMQAKLRRAFHPMRGKKSLVDQSDLLEAAES